MKIAFLFPGQGSQCVGMGSALYNTFDVARKTYEEASDRLGWDVAKVCFDGPEEILNQTEYTQPALLTTSIAAWRALGIPAQTGLCVAGHSLGEYTALLVAEAISFGDAVWLVRERGRFMQEASGDRVTADSIGAEDPTVVPTATRGSWDLAPPRGGGMAAIIGLNRMTVQAICQKVSTPSEPVAPANYNAPDQIVIAGRNSAVEKAMALAEKEGAKRALRLAVSVPSHSPLMRPACQKLKEALEEIAWNDLVIPLINNLEAKVITKGSDACAALVDQLAHPLLWEESVQAMRVLGADFFIEIGPNRVLSGLLKRIDRALQVISAERPEEIEKVRTIITEGK